MAARDFTGEIKPNRSQKNKQRKNRTMSTLVVIGYNELHKAEEIRLTLVKLQKDYLIDLEDAVAVTKDADGRVKPTRPST